MRATWFFALVAVATACTGAPGATQSVTFFDGLTSFPVAALSTLEQGCEHVDDASLTAHPTDSPELAVLVNERGVPICVDAIDLLVDSHPEGFSTYTGARAGHGTEAPPASEAESIYAEAFYTEADRQEFGRTRHSLRGDPPAEDGAQTSDPEPDPMIAEVNQQGGR